MATSAATRRPPGVGDQLRRWRTQRRLSQMDLSLRAEVSTRHLSFVETGRSRPSRELLLQLARHLDVPLRDRNALLVAAGYAPVFTEGALDEPERAAVGAAIERVLHAHEPWPAIVVDRHWNLITANRAAAILVEGVAPELLGPPTNVLRVLLHPDGMAPRVTHLGHAAAHVLGGLRRQIDVLGDPELMALAAELESYPDVAAALAALPTGSAAAEGAGLAMTLGLRHGDHDLSFVSMIATFGTSVDATLSELTLETFLPADAATAAYLAR